MYLYSFIKSKKMSPLKIAAWLMAAAMFLSAFALLTTSAYASSTPPGTVVALLPPELQHPPGTVISQIPQNPPNVALTPPAQIQPAPRPPQIPRPPSNAPSMRGMWVTTVINLDWPSRPGLSNAQMMAEADRILDNAAAIGINAIFLQVRPAGDAIYNSAIYPWSKYITGTQGQAPAGGFSPLRYWIDGAHSRGMELHAWINPYRVTHSTSNITNVNHLSRDNPARINPTWARAHGRALYLDPGRPEVRRLIIDGVVELITNYNVDGIHFDDYFYPGRDFNDAATFAAFGRGWNCIHNWRREQVNILIRDTQRAIRATRPEVRFGVSPFAIWQNRSPTQPLGSNTRGFESYHQIYSDSRRWVQEGWVDYIVPQIYWRIGFEIADFTTVLHWWRDVVDGTDVNLYIGMAAWRDAREEPQWSGEMWRQLRYTSRYPDVDGHLFFRAGYMTGRVGGNIQYFYRNTPAR